MSRVDEGNMQNGLVAPRDDTAIDGQVVDQRIAERSVAWEIDADRRSSSGLPEGLWMRQTGSLDCSSRRTPEPVGCHAGVRARTAQMACRGIPVRDYSWYVVVREALRGVPGITVA